MVIGSGAGTLFFSSCSKSTCNNVACQHGGTCSGGKCTCPTGYYGNRCETAATTYIVYKNNTFTPISITVNDLALTIPVHGSVSFSGRSGSLATGGAVTSGEASWLGISAGGGVIGQMINWKIDNTFPLKDTLYQALDVGATYFFLRMVNSTGQNVINYDVNYDRTNGEQLENVTVPNTGSTYDMGYYFAYSNSDIKITTAASGTYTYGISVPGTSNQTVTVTVH